MQANRKVNKLLGIAALAMLFSASVQAQTGTGSSQGGSQGSTTSAASSDTGKSAAGKSSISKAEQKMMRDMAHANLNEIEASKLALEKSQNGEVKAYAQKMIDDHTQAQKELEQLAQAKGVKLPTEPDAKHKSAMKKMSGMDGEKFDQMYMAQGGVRDHKNTHQLLEKAEKSAKDPELKAHVEKIKPIVSQHLAAAQAATSAKDGAKTSGSGASSGSSSASGSGTTSSTTGSPSPTGSEGVSGTSGSSNSHGPGK